MRRDVFQAIADPNRRAIIGLLTARKLTLNEIAEHFPVSRPAISKHVKILTECGLVSVTSLGRERYCEATLNKLKEVADWSAQYKAFWTARLDALEDFLGRMDNPGKGAGAPKGAGNQKGTGALKGKKKKR